MKRGIRVYAAILLLALVALAAFFAAPRNSFASTLLAAEKAPLVDLNSASKLELVKLPGVGEAIAEKIIAGRPWKSKYDLVVKQVVSRNVYDKFAKLVIARQAGRAK